MLAGRPIRAFFPWTNAQDQVSNKPGQLHIAEVGTVLLDELADGLGWSLGRCLYALTVLESRPPSVGQRLSWLADS